MCDPHTSMAMQYGGAGYQAAGAYFATKSQQVAYGAAADIAEVNAKMAEVSAQSALNAGQKEQQTVLLKGAEIEAAQKAETGASNIAPDSSTAIERQASSELIAKNDAFTANANAVRQAWGYRMNATNYQNEALMARTTAGALSPFSAFAGSLMSSASSIAMSRYRMGAVGALPTGLGESSYYSGSNTWVDWNK